jgi:hypothetical protein
MGFMDAADLRHVAEVETRDPELVRHAEDLPKRAPSKTDSVPST